MTKEDLIKKIENIIEMQSLALICEDCRGGGADGEENCKKCKGTGLHTWRFGYAAKEILKFFESSEAREIINNPESNLKV